MPSVYEMFGTDAEKEKNGVEVDFGSFKFTVGRAGPTNPRYVKALESRTRPHKRAIETGTIDQELAKQIDREAFVEGCMIGWEGITDEHNNVIPFSYDAAVKLFTDLPDLFLFIKEEAKKGDLFRRATNESIAGN